MCLFLFRKLFCDFVKRKSSLSDFVCTMDIFTEKSLPAVCGGLGVIEYETNVETCDVGTVENNKWRMRHFVENNSSSE